MPMKGSKELFTDFKNLVRVPNTMFVYMICLDESICDISDWADTGYSSLEGYLNVNPSESTLPQKIYFRIIPAGSYTFSSREAAYLFTDDMEGKF